ncbi:hypothetical protein ACJJTC_007114 [Scirpophaga incertulas]
MLLQRRSLRSRLDLLRSVSARELCVSRAQHSQQQHAGGVLRDLAPGEPVWARSFRQPDKWLKGTVANNQGTNRYVVNSGDGRLIPRHIDQIRRRSRMSDVPCPSGTNSDQFEGQVSIGSEDALADSNIPDVGSNDDVAEAISVTKSNSEISVPKPVEDPSEPTCTPGSGAVNNVIHNYSYVVLVLAHGSDEFIVINEMSSQLTEHTRGPLIHQSLEV